MIAIVAVDKNWAIGKDNKLLAHLPSDLKRFKELTKGNIVVMGRKTLESLPGGKPLKGRQNLVLTRDENFQPINVGISHSLNHILTYTRAVTKMSDTEVYIMGGASIYEQFLPFCEKVLVTKIDYAFEGADAHFPDLDQMSEWRKVEGEIVEENGYKYQYLTYVR